MAERAAFGLAWLTSRGCEAGGLCFGACAGVGEGVKSAERAGAAGFPVPCGVRSGAADLRTVRRVTARWAVLAGLPEGRAEDFVNAVSEIAANAVRYGSPAARLLLRAARRRRMSATAVGGGRVRERPPVTGAVFYCRSTARFTVGLQHRNGRTASHA